MASMSARLDLSDTRALLSAAAKAVIANKDRLTKADQDIGDGDHGVGMARGFAAFDEAAAKEAGSIAELFRNCGKAHDVERRGFRRHIRYAVPGCRKSAHARDS